MMRSALWFIVAVMFLFGCSPQATAVPPQPTAAPSSIPTAVSTSTPSPMPPTPSPTALPGAIVLPIDSLGTGIPWLPLNETARPAVHVIHFNTARPPFDNSLVRQAFAHATDRDVLVKMAQKYAGVKLTAATTLIPPQTLGRDLYGQVGAGFDPQKAKDLLTEAGYSDPSAFPSATLIVASYGDIAPGVRFNMANAMAKMWRDTLGVQVDVQAIGGFKQYTKRVQTDPPEMIWMGWVADVNDPDNFMRIFHSGAEFNYGKFSSSEFDQLIDRAAQSSDPAARQLLYIQAERLLCETEAALIPLYHVR